jgi:pyridoxal phosphate enzyme (YggS family)
MSDENRMLLAGNLQAIRERIALACQRSGRSQEEITLLAVTKYADLDWVRELIALGLRDLGEARPQQLTLRARELSADVRWHLIGHLQRNKAADVLPVVHLVHSVDSLRLFEHLANLSRQSLRQASVLLEVNVSGEKSKDGFDPAELLAAWPQMHTCESLNIAGLMTMAPLSDEAEASRPFFRRLRELRDQLRSECNHRWPLDQLSMGMSGDFEIGIEEGATIVRIGSLLFEGLSTGSH